MISIIIPTYSNATFLSEAVDSALQQQVEDLEIIVVLDDEIVGEAQNIMRQYRDHPIIQCAISPKNSETIARINQAVAMARGEYLLVLDKDSLLEPGVVLRLYKILEKHHECGYVFGRYKILLPEGALIPFDHPGWLNHDYTATRDEFPCLLAFGCYAHLSATLLRRSVLTALSEGTFFDETLTPLVGDESVRTASWDLLLRLSLHGIKSAFINESVSLFRQHGIQQTSDADGDKDGSVLSEYMLLLQRFVSEKNGHRLYGYLSRIRDVLQHKYEVYCTHGKQTVPQIDAQIKQRYRMLYNQLNAMNVPHFSVIVTTYHDPSRLVEVLRSIINQKLKDFEIIVVNHGKGWQETVLDWLGGDPRITYIYQPHRSLSAARNTALKLARGDYIIYVDDGLMQAHHLEIVKLAYEQYPDQVVYSDAELVTETFDSGIRREVKRTPILTAETFDSKRLHIANYIPANTWAHPRSLIDKVGLFDESLTLFEDWDMLIRLARVTAFHHIKKITIELHQCPEKKNSMADCETEVLRETYKYIYDKYDDLGDNVIKVGRATLLATDNLTEAPPLSSAYQRWFEMHTLGEVDAEILAERMIKARPANPMMTLLMKVAAGNINDVVVTLESLQKQFYPSWRLILIADYPAPDPVFQASDMLGWFQIDNVDDAQQFASACNILAQQASGNWVGLFPAGAEFSPDWLLRCADYTYHKTNLHAFYCDHDIRLMPGIYDEPQLKPDFNLTYLLSYDYIGESVWFRQTSMVALGGIQAFPGSEVYELLLRVVDQYGEGAVGHVSDPMLHLPKLLPTELTLAARHVAIENHLARMGSNWRVEAGFMPQTFRLVGPLEGTPLVSIIIPNRDKLEFLQPCIESIFAKTRYPRWEIIIVDNRSEDPDTLAYYKELTCVHEDRVRIAFYDDVFNFSAQCNLGEHHARGDYLLLLNNDTEVVQPEWLERLVMQAQRPGVGIVGAKLLYPETSKIQHAGVLLGVDNGMIDSIATHYGGNEKVDAAGYMNRLQCDIELSAVTAACLLVRRSIYQQVKGLNERLRIYFNDVDFCLRVRAAGFKVVWTPYSIVIHHHGKSISANTMSLASLRKLTNTREQVQLETHFMFETWLPMLANDPSYNRNLTLVGKPLEIDSDAPFMLGAEFTERPRIVAIAPVAGGSGLYRVTQPLTELSKVGYVQPAIYRSNRMLTVTEVKRVRPDVLVLQNAITDGHLEVLPLYKRYFPMCLKVMLLDDLVTSLPEENSLYRGFMQNFRDSKTRIRQALQHVDRVIVSTEALAEFICGYMNDVIVVPNRLSKVMWGGLTSKRRAGRKPRVGWVGAQQHKGDLALLREVIIETAHEVEWVFMGMWPEGVDHCIREKVPAVPYDAYPKRMAALNLDLAVAPLDVHPFNESKSNLRLLEYGALGWPVVCTDIAPYRANNAPVARVANTKEAWLQAIRDRVYDLDRAYQEGDALKRWVQAHYFLEDHLLDWANAYKCDSLE